MKEHYTWLFDKPDSRGLWWGFFGSLLLHVLMLAIMATTSIFLPLAGDDTKLNILWIYPPFLLGAESEPAAPTPLAQVENASSMTSNMETAPPNTIQRQPEPLEEATETRNTEPSPSPAPQREEEAKPVPLLSEPLSQESDEVPEMSIPAVPPPQPVEVKRERPETAAAQASPPPVEKLRPATNVETKPEPPIAKAKIVNAEKPALVSEAPKPPSVEKPPAPHETPLQHEKPQMPVQQTVAKDSARPPQVIPAIPAKETEAAPAKQPQSSPSPTISSKKQAVATAPPEKRIDRPSNDKPATDTKLAQKLPTQSTVPKGLFTPPLTGDLKIEITGPDEALKTVKISVVFREYPKTRHNRPMTKATARNFRILTPKMARIAKNTLQAVIEIAEEGVYDFKNLSDSASSAEVTFKVKVYENSGKAKTKSAGSRMIRSTGSIAKVLMPEGILWNDESAFSGSMEDSESITRFNTDTGLVWKEYKE